MKFNTGSTIGLLGGTFDPIHLGHLHIIEKLANRFDQILLIPTGIPLMKSKHPVASGSQRVEMCQAALEDLSEDLQEKVSVSDIEVNREGPSYSFDTLQSLKAFFPRDSFTLIIGSDVARTFNEWKRPADIKKMAEILVVKRPGAEPSEFKELEISAPNISSTQIRAELKSSGSSDLVSKNVLKYIKAKGLYAGE